MYVEMTVQHREKVLIGRRHVDSMGSSVFVMLTKATGSTIAHVRGLGEVG